MPDENKPAIEHFISLYEQAIDRQDSEACARLCLAVEVIADFTGFDDHGRLKALHTRYEQEVPCTPPPVHLH